MLRGVRTSFSRPTHDVPGWALVRYALGAAELDRSTSEPPSLCALVLEIEAIAGIARRDGRLPFDGNGIRTAFISLREEIHARWSTAGENVCEIVGGALPLACADEPDVGADPDYWDALLKAGEVAATSLRGASAPFAALTDAIVAGAQVRPLADAIESVLLRVDEFRAAIELQGLRSWDAAVALVRGHLTVGPVDSDGQNGGAPFVEGTDPDAILAALESALSHRASTVDWAVWIPTRAGTAPERSWPSVVTDAFAVSGISGREPVAEWLAEVRDDLSQAFVAAGFEVPADVYALGQPLEYNGETVLDADDLWAFAMSPPSFLTRVAVRAATRAGAIEIAKRALRAVFQAHSPQLANDVLPRVVVWRPEQGWESPGSSARDRGQGELFAARAAGRATRLYGSGLGAPLDPERLDHFAARTLASDRTAPVEVRLMRAWSELERLKPPGAPLVNVGPRLWLRSAWAEARAMINDLLEVTSEFVYACPVADGVAAEALQEAIEAADRLRQEASRITQEVDSCKLVTPLFHPDSLNAALARQLADTRVSPTWLAERQCRHAQAFRRALRHRNLVMHGHRLPALVVAPTATFLARQLDIATLADDARHGPPFDWLGSLSTGPNKAWRESTLDDLIQRLDETSGPPGPHNGGGSGFVA